MGKISSKHEAARCKRTAPEGECFLVNTKVASVKDLMDALNSRDSLSEAFLELAGNKQMQDGVAGQEIPTIELTTGFISCCGKPDSNGLLDPRLFNIPLRVTLPPLTKETNLLKLLTVDRTKVEGSSSASSSSSSSSEGIQTDTTDNNHGSDKTGHPQDNECGITVQGNDLQEWHFTLYDFDDLGKITKEDIAGLLKSLYDTVGSVITLQQQGTRVLKLHLTVTPDQGINRTTASGTLDNGCAAQEHQCAKGSSAPLRAANVGALSTSKKPSRPTKCTLVHQGSPRTPHQKTMPDRRPPVLASRDKRPDVISSSDRKTVNNLLPTRRMSFCGGVGTTDVTAVTSGSTPGANIRRRQQQRHVCSGGTSKRISPFDEKQLAHLIQQNMSLNDQHLQYSRRTGHRRSVFLNRSHANDPSSADRTCTNSLDDCGNEESAQRRNYYLDLAGIENYTTSDAHELDSSAHPSCGIFGAEKSSKSQKPAKCRSKMTSSAVKHFERYNATRTDARGPDTICEENETIESNVSMAARHESSQFGSSPLNLKFPVTVNSSSSKPEPNDLETVSSSHYHRRHRHREKNQSRAMKQVAEWIEKEHIYHKSEKRVVVVQRHEHHHVHEHFHHHFHHCSHI